MNTAAADAGDERIMIAHGGGGELTHRLIAERILPKLRNPLLDPLTDGAILHTSGHIVFTTDAFVVQPLVFPGGDIGRLAVCGTVNDLAVMGARPKALSLALVLEEGLPLSMLDQIIDSIAAAAAEAGVVVATGDTKVVERRNGQDTTLTTAGIGEMRENVRLGVQRIVPGDLIMITGRIAEHGLAVMSVREGLTFQTELRSDVAPLANLIGHLFDSGVDLKFLRDPTRSGLAGVLADLAEDAGFSAEVQEQAIPISAVAQHTSELLGLDPLTVANEGKCVVVVPAWDADRVLRACHSHPQGEHAAIIGRMVDRDPPLAELLTRTGGRRIIQRPYGEELPRIC